MTRLIADPERFVDLGAVVRRAGGDPHLRHDLEDPGIHGLQVAFDHLVGGELFELALGMQRIERLQSEVGMHRIGPEANQT